MSSIWQLTADEIAAILAGNGKWQRGEPGGKRADLGGASLYGASLYGADLAGANLTRANLTRADLTQANLYGANLCGADLTQANLYGANLCGAKLTQANLYGANLCGANLCGANLAWANLCGANLARANLTQASLYEASLYGATLPEGITWEKYLAEVVPALLVVNGHSIDNLLAAKAWDCHDWANCPMANAFGVHELAEVPILLRPRANEFVRFFDARLIPMPRQLADGTWTCLPEPKQTPVAGS